MTTVTSSTTNGVTSYSGTASSLTDTSTSRLSQDTLDQDDFLALLTAQLQAQDPLNPTSNADLVAQMATITNTSGISEMNNNLATISSTISSLASSLDSSRLSTAASWIGHAMLVSSNSAAPNTAGDYSGQFTIATAADDVKVNLVDSSGNTVKTIDLGSQAAGDVTFYWDGKDEDGNYVGGDTYTVQVEGVDAKNVATWTSIAAVQSPADDSSAKLITTLGTYSPSDAIKLL